jgi:hypothetical protein
VLPARLRLLSRTFLDQTASVIPEPASSAAFLLELLCDAAGNTVDADHDGLPDVFPTIRLVKLDPGDPTGMTYDESSGGRVVIPAVIDPTTFLGAAGLSCAGTPRKSVTDVPVLAFPLAVKLVPGLPVQVLPSIPPGRYGVVAIQANGQVWRVPNELQPTMLDDQTPPSVLAALLTQGLAFVVR